MIIDITRSAYRKGYVQKVGSGIYQPFFPTANAAFRREALQKVGGFDPRCQTGEDIDLCIRVAQAGNELWFEPSARVHHHHRSTLRGLLRQWFGYGLGHGYLFKKHVPARRLQIHRRDHSPRNKNPYGIACVLDIPCPVHGSVFLSSYHLMHVAFVVSLLCFALSAPLWGMVAALLALSLSGRYVARRYDLRQPFKSLVLLGIRYLADSAYVLGGLLGGFKEGILYLEATR
jgi:cellulose synthase/poly-beta-1,6-N-acetylglucosamine synthase-like glycosyltransferase